MGRQRTAPGARKDPDASDIPLGLPAPYEALSDSEVLIDMERRDLAACEAAIDGLRIAFWAAGKALQVIRDARLYRAEYPTFDAYCEGRWQIHRSYADKLIRAWPLAEILSPIGLKELNEGQVRELLPLAATQGEEAAVIVYEAAYRAVAEVDGVRVTAAVLKGAVGALPDGQFDKDEAVRQIREYVARLAGGDDDQAAGDVGLSDDDRWTAEKDRVRADFRKILSRGRGTIRNAAKSNPEGARELLDEVEQEATLYVAELRAILDARSNQEAAQ
jgi:hypothetical protein